MGFESVDLTDFCTSMLLGEKKLLNDLRFNVLNIYLLLLKVSYSHKVASNKSNFS